MAKVLGGDKKKNTRQRAKVQPRALMVADERRTGEKYASGREIRPSHGGTIKRRRNYKWTGKGGNRDERVRGQKKKKKEKGLGGERQGTQSPEYREQERNERIEKKTATFAGG